MSLEQRLQTIQIRVAKATSEAGRGQQSVRLIAVSKTHPSALIENAHRLGVRVFGENYADELADKQASLKHLSDLVWVYIGQLQSNKIKKIVMHADEIQSIATEKHARYVERYVAEAGKSKFPVWIVVNAEAEDTKAGATFTDVPNLAHFIATACPHLVLQGIMAIPPAKYSDQAQVIEGKIQVPELYKELRKLADQTGLGKLSLGMTGDLQIAIAAGSDCIRIGTAIFGERARK
jgi:pyridoxal phosphate enzyme (YggS family)